MREPHEFIDWEDQDQPVLEAVYASGRARDRRQVTANDFPHFERGQFATAIQRLHEDGLIAGPVETSEFIVGAMPTGSLRVTPAGLRLLHKWPPDGYPDMLIRHLERIAADEPDPRRQNAARKALAAVREFTLEFGARATAETFNRMG
jgi:hypothetical protein